MAGTGLANFREQFPQYDHIDDEELAGLVKDQYYPDMPDDVYRDRMGLPPLETPQEPSLWDRVTGIFRSDDAKPENVLSDRPDMVADFDMPDEEEPEASPLLRDQFFAGWDEYRANRATARAFGALDDYVDARTSLAAASPSAPERSVSAAARSRGRCATPGRNPAMRRQKRPSRRRFRRIGSD